MNNRDKRIDWIDIAKGIGVLLVVFGHESIPPILKNWIYSFHMPLFFILSGYTYKQKSGYIREVIVSFRKLIVPYMIYSICFLGIDIVIFGTKSTIVQDDILNIASGRGS